MKKNQKPVVLVVIDGLGLRKTTHGNAYAQAHTPVLDELLANYPNAILGAAGNAVGLPEGQIGNSEVGHLNIGAGTIVYTGISLIQNAIDQGTFFTNEAFQKSIAFAQKNHSIVQVVGLLSPGGVHSHEDHLFALLKILHEQKVPNVTVHVFADGRDVKPRSILPSLKKLMKLLQQYKYDLGSIGGRLYGMDRDTNFDKTEIAFEAMQGRANLKFSDPIAFINDQYQKQNHNDEFIDVAINSDPHVKFFKDGDAVIFFNFRPDRARQLSHFIIGSNLYDYQPQHPVHNTQLTTMMKYEGIDRADVAFASFKVHNTIGSVAASHQMRQLRIAETQKYAHVTFFMDGGQDIIFPHEIRKLVPSVKVDNFANAPKMSTKEITDTLINNLPNFDLVIMNYASPDMVGHTGQLEPAKIAVGFMDQQIGRMKQAIDDAGGTMFITADHGNAEKVLDDGDMPETKHTTNDVFLISTDKSLTLKNGVLANVAPTILDYMGLPQPSSMTHKSLIVKQSSKS